jgi:hypothetical protein
MIESDGRSLPSIRRRSLWAAIRQHLFGFCEKWDVNTFTKLTFSQACS